MHVRAHLAHITEVMNDHLLPYIYRQTRGAASSRYEPLAEWLYGIYIRDQPMTDVSPEPDRVKIVCISDTHGRAVEVPEGDMLIHAGDLSRHGSFEELQNQLTWLSSLPHLHKVVIAGNHDLLLDESFPLRSPALLLDVSLRSELQWGDICYLQDRAVSLEFPSGRRLRIYGSPRTPQFGNWAFQYPAIRDVWTGTIPSNVDVVVTHGPPLFYGDVDRHGDGYLLRELRRVKPQLSVFGHIHDGYGEERLLHDAVQEARENIRARRSGIVAILRIVVGIAAQWLGSQRRLRPTATRLVNAAVAPGTRYKTWKEAIVVQL